MTAIVLRGDARQLPLPDASVDLIVTSPPYFGLRSYTDGGTHYGGQIGSEATPAEYITALVECTREWVRVLKPSGSIFVNLGDKYSTFEGPRTKPRPEGTISAKLIAASQERNRYTRSAPTVYGIPYKSLLGLPWRYAIACTDQLGLILRRDIIWAKPNGLPESVTDRCRSSHEYVFHLVKQPRYYAAVDEIREPHSGPWKSPGSGNPAVAVGPQGRNGHSQWERSREERDATVRNPLGKLPGSVWNIPSAPLTVPPHLGVDHFAAFPPELPRRIILGWSPPGVCTACGEGRRPVSESEYRKHRPSGGTTSRIERGNKIHDGGAGQWGTFGTNLRRDVTITGYACACTPHTDHEGTGETSGPSYAQAIADGTHPNVGAGWGGKGGLGDRPRVGPWREYHFDAWTPPPTRPALVVDPFGGTGTTALVAAAYGRLGVTIDMSADYSRLAAWRVSDPAERARAMHLPKPPPIPDGQASLFDFDDELTAMPGGALYALVPC